jgi:hypothetical protein
MVTQYRRLLIMQITQLLNPNARGHRRGLSTKSNSAISISSDKSGTHPNDKDSWE